MAELIEKISSFADKYIIDAVSEIGFNDIVDILIMSYLLFCVFRFIKERRAGRLALGLAVLAVVAIVSVVFNLKSVNFIFEHFYQIGLIALVVIFQSDLRAALEKVGNTPIRNLKKSFSESDYQKTLEMAENICRACDNMSRSKTGALIAIELETKLGDYLAQGTIVNADVQELLIRNIFFNKSPLHDGAMIIRDRRVYAAGCYLPLSTADVNKALGTRHRAAIGLSEVSDAIVIVCSEETGTISIAKDGVLTSNYNFTSLKQAILNYTVPEEMEKIRQKNLRKAAKRGLKK